MKKNISIIHQVLPIVDIYIERQILLVDRYISMTSTETILMVVLINIYLLVVEGDRQIDIQVYRYIYLSPLTSTIIQTNRYLCL
jgi:hypothetical protein